MTASKLPEQPAASAEAHTEFQWHPDLHKAWAHEQLYFMRLGFAPVYQRERIQAALREIFAEHDVRSYVAYELLGVYDVMLRLWLPASTTQEAFRESVRKALKAVNMTVSDPFVVFRQERNWLWEENGRMVTPDQGRLRNGPPDANELRRLWADPAVFDDFRRANLVRALPRHDGVKFFMVLPAPQHAADDDLDALYEAIGEALNKVSLSEYSLYIGQGFGSGAAVVMGRIAFDRFYDIGDRLSGEILKLTKLLGVRTYTFPVSSNRFLLYAERPPGVLGSPHRDDESPSIESLLYEGESQWVETKGSAFVPLRLLFGEGQRIDGKSNTDAAKSFLRAMVGMLNASGGTIVLGALEGGRFSEEVVRQYFGDCPRRGSYFCLGLDQEIAAAGGLDRFEQRIRAAIEAHIVEAPIRRYQIEFPEVEGRTLALLRIRQPMDEWFYLDGKEFIVRDGNKAEALDLPKMDRYRERYPRMRTVAQ